MSNITKLPALSTIVNNTKRYTSSDLERLEELCNKEFEAINKAKLSLKAKEEKIASIQQYLTFVKSTLSMSVDSEDIYSNSPVVDSQPEEEVEMVGPSKQM